jgi:TolB protein
MDADGTGLKGGELADDFAWSPDSSRLAVVDVTGGIRLYYPGMSLYKTLAEASFTGYGGLSWAPDSQKLAVSARSGTGGNHAIYVYTWRNGVLAREITGGMGNDIEPLFQPAFFRITYVSDRAGAYDIWDGNDAGQGIVNITQYTGLESQLSWSPKGGKLLFVRGTGTQADIWTMNADGTNQVNLTNTLGEDVDPVWSPDGEQILFTSSRDGNPEIYLMNADGTNQVNLTLNPAIDRKPSWFPK